MPYPRLFPTLAVALVLPVLALAQAPAPDPGPPAPPPPPTEAEKAVDAAIAKLRALPSVAADVTEDVQMLNQKFRLSGRYLKDASAKGAAPRIYLRLRLENLADAKGQLLQVCDGTTLWHYTEILGSQSLRKFNVSALFKKLESPDADDELRQNVRRGLGFAGPDALLEGLRQAFVLDQMSEDTFMGKPVLVIAGKWKDYEGLTPPGQPPFPATAPLPPYVPLNVTLILGKDDGWPYQVRLRGRKLSVMELKEDDRPKDLNGRPIGVKTARQPENPTEIVLSYTNVELSPKLTIDDFAFSAPPNLQVVDDTEQTVAQLENALNNAAARKRAEAAKAAGETLPGSLEAKPAGPAGAGAPGAGVPGAGAGPAPGSAAPLPADSFRSTAPPPK